MPNGRTRGPFAAKKHALDVVLPPVHGRHRVLRGCGPGVRAGGAGAAGSGAMGGAARAAVAGAGAQLVAGAATGGLGGQRQKEHISRWAAAVGGSGGGPRAKIPSSTQLRGDTRR